MTEPKWPNVKYPRIDFQDISYYSAPKAKPKLASMDEVDPELIRRSRSSACRCTSRRRSPASRST